MDSPRVGPEREKGKSTTSSTPLAAVASFWKDFDLEKERSTLDEQGLRIAENQENSQKNRRKLAESTRDFRKASNEDKFSLFNSLLKGYQEEVDNLTKRAKYGENAFLNIYQKLYEAPDPYPVIASIAFGQVDSCGYWEWHDEVLPDRALVVISNIKAQLDVATVKVSNLSSALDAVKIERVNLKEKVNIMEAINNYQVIKSRDLEEKLRKMKMCFLASCALFVGFVAALLMK
ncbi:protein CASP-like isoform X1 [Nicotiana tomentosiformis]|uniref:protein CASP-like isoform X1 n=1 Tax=Nicotiana tomentosiformis TaxID=4098 RepID=UPI00051AFD21|nr:protein CASP-like isoform X1 [Nicotiana tomentosiformis]